MDIYRMFFLTTLFIHDSVLQLLLLEKIEERTARVWGYFKYRRK